MGIGVCFGISFDNLIVGLMLGVGIGMCFAVSFGAFKEDETEGCPKETKEKDTEEASEDIPSEKS